MQSRPGEDAVIGVERSEQPLCSDWHARAMARFYSSSDVECGCGCRMTAARSPPEAVPCTNRETVLCIKHEVPALYRSVPYALSD